MNWYETDVSRFLEIKYPIIQGPFGGGHSSVPLLAAVSNLGGLGSFGAHYLPVEQLRLLHNEIRSVTKNPFAINLWVSDQDSGAENFSKMQFDLHLKKLRPYFKMLSVAEPELPIRFGQKFTEQIEVLLEEKPPVFSFVFGIPDKAILIECRKRNIKTIGTATTVDEAVAIADTGVDLIVASGFEAGGHRGSFLISPEKSLVGIFALVPQIAAAVKTPVIAAGGIVDGRGIAAALKLGARGVQIGTAFLACNESNAPAEHKKMLLSKGKAGVTALTRAFTGRLARGIENQFMRDTTTLGIELPPYPIQAWLTQKLKQAAILQGKYDYISLWASQSYSLLRHTSVDELFNSLVDEATGLLV